MDARLIESFETNVERAASALFGGAAGFAAFQSLRLTLAQPALAASAIGAALLAGVICYRITTGATRRRPRFPVPVFDVRGIEFDELGELVLTDADRLNAELMLTDADRLDAAPLTEHGEPLMLDDVLAEIAPDSRVVRLFDRKAMPTPGQLKSRIDRHVVNGAPPAAPSDASEALSAALAELRRSLR